MLFTLSANSNRCYLHQVQIAIDSIYTVKIAKKNICILLIANNGNYLHLSIVVHYKIVHNNNVLRVNLSFNSNY